MRRMRAAWTALRLRHPVDVTDAEWALVAPLIRPAKRCGRSRTVEVREVLNAILHVLSSGCQWAALPKELAPKSTVWGDFSCWDWKGMIARLHHALCVAVRDEARREASPTTASIGTEGHSQTAKAAQRGFSRLGPSGCDAGKKVVGRTHDAEAGRAVLDACADGPRGRNCAAIVAWQQHWPGVIRFFAFPAELRRIATAPRSCCAKPGAARSERAATFRTTTPRSSSCSWFRTAPQRSGRY
jgi:transposase